MRIGFDITPLSVPQSGVGTYTVNLFEELRLMLGDHLLPLIHRPLHDPEMMRGCRDSLVPWGRGMNKTLWMQMLLPWQLARAQATLAHFTNSVAPLVSPCKTVVTIHDMTLWLFPEHHYRRRLLAMRPFVPLAARRAAAIITVSHSAKSDIVRILGVPEEKVHVIYEAASPVFRPLRSAPCLEEVRARYHLPEHFLLYVGTIEPRKNLVRLLEAFATLRASGRIAHDLLFVGARGWKEDPVFEAVERLGLGDKVRFMNHVPTADLVALYNLADALAFPSLYEGFGLPVVEAMACGTPVVTSAEGSLGEIAGDAAEMVDPLSVPSIAQGLEAVLTDRARQGELRQRGLARVRDFTWQGAAAQTRQLYGAIVG